MSDHTDSEREREREQTFQLHGNLEDAKFVLTDQYLIAWSALFWALGVGTGYLVLL